MEEETGIATSSFFQEELQPQPGTTLQAILSLEESALENEILEMKNDHKNVSLQDTGLYRFSGAHPTSA
jgi:hypothetical protein